LRSLGAVDLLPTEAAAVCGLEPTLRLCHRTSECSFFVAEEFTFEQSARNGYAVGCHEPVLAAWAGLVNRPCDYFLAGAGFSLNENCRVHGRHHVDVIE